MLRFACKKYITHSTRIRSTYVRLKLADRSTTKASAHSLFNRAVRSCREAYAISPASRFRFGIDIPNQSRWLCIRGSVDRICMVLLTLFQRISNWNWVKGCARFAPLVVIKRDRRNTWVLGSWSADGKPDEAKVLTSMSSSNFGYEVLVSRWMRLKIDIPSSKC